MGQKELHLEIQEVKVDSTNLLMIGVGPCGGGGGGGSNSTMAGCHGSNTAPAQNSGDGKGGLSAIASHSGNAAIAHGALEGATFGAATGNPGNVALGAVIGAAASCGGCHLGGGGGSGAGSAGPCM